MDKNPFNLKILEEKPEGFLDTDEFILFLEKRKILVRKDNLPRFCDGHGIHMLKFKRIGKAGSTPTCYKIPNDKKIERHSKRLLQFLKSENLTPIGNTKFLGYNPPWQVLGRKNEVAIEVNYSPKL